MTRRPFREAHIDLGAISHNVETLRALIGTEHFMAVVKSGAYGHGAIPSALAAIEGGADWLGVVDLAEAMALRAAGIDAPVLAWLHDPDATFDDAIEARVDIGVSYLEQLDRVAAASASLPASVQLKVDTGLGRNGAADVDWPEFFAAAAAHERAGRIRVRGVWSHLANSGEHEDLAQIASFDDAIAQAHAAGLRPQLRHIAATAGALRVPQSRYDLVRVGLGIYGLSPFDDATSADFGLRPALELSTVVASVKRVPRGSGVSYAYAYRTERETSLALVPLGYSDGIPRHASNTGIVSINGRHYPIAGRVAMDQFVVDVGDDPVSVGDRVVVIGDPATGAPTPEDWARSSDTINYEIVSRLGGRVERTYS